MKTITYLFVLILSFWSCKADYTSDDSEHSSSPKAENVSTSISKPKNYTIPSFTPIDKKKVASLCKNECLVEDFLPIGWSEDTKYFSWIVQNRNTSYGGYYFSIYIQDMITEQMAWEWTFNERDLEDWDEVSNYDITQVWRDQHPTFTEKLNAYGIIQINEPKKLLEFPATIEGRVYSITLETQTRNNVDYGHTEIGEEIIYLHAEGLGSKKILHDTFEEGDWGIRQSLIQGVMLTDNRERAAIIRLNETSDWEGRESVLFVDVVGGHLREGFKE